MNKRFAVAVLLVFLVAMATSCNYRILKTSGANDGHAPSAASAGAADYSTVKTIFQTKCVTCHGSAGGVSLDSYVNVIKFLPLIRAQLSAGSMPPKSPLDGRSRDIIIAWIDSGAPLALGPSTPTPSATPTPPLAPTFTSISANIFVPRCISCHSASGEESDVPLVTYQDLVSGTEPLVNPASPDKSLLMQMITKTDGDRMPPPEAGEPLTVEEIATIRQWITDNVPQ